jgi:predicted phage replisome organizer
MSDTKKYYYIMIKENFYDTDDMIILRNMPDGYLYSDILMQLYLRSLKTMGTLMYKDKIPYNPTILAQIVRHPVGVVEKALQIFIEMELIEILDNGAIYMLDIQNFIGKSSTDADRKRATYIPKSEQKHLECIIEKKVKTTSKVEVLQCNTDALLAQQVIDYWQIKTNLKATSATLKMVMPIISKLLKTYSTTDMTTVIDFILSSEYHIQGGYTTLQSIFKPTKFDEKLTRAQAASNPSLKAKASTKDAIRNSLYTDDPTRRVSTPEEQEKLKNTVIPF